MENYQEVVERVNELKKLDSDPAAHGLKFHHVALRRGYIPLLHDGKGYIPDWYSGRFGSGIQRVCSNRGSYRPYRSNSYHYVEFYVYE